MSIFLNKTYGKNKLTVQQVLSDPVLLLAFGFGSGLAKKMPGTMGTVAAIPIYLAIVQANIWLYSAITIIVVISGVYLCEEAANKLGEHDFGGIVWDEIAGLLITLWFFPFSWFALVAGFILFRLFDILKPWPIKWVDQKVSGGLGIMLDDVLAGLLAAVVLQFMI